MYLNGDIALVDLPHVEAHRWDHVLIELATLREMRKREVSSYTLAESAVIYINEVYIMLCETNRHMNKGEDGV